MFPSSNVPPEAPPPFPVLEYLDICGYGGMSVVWRARHRALDRVVAVKVLDREFAASPEDVNQFMAEGRTMAYLDHPGIVHGYGVTCTAGRYINIMDYVDGYSLGALLQRKGRICEDDARIVYGSVAAALKYAWDGFRTVHCDLKPDNLMVSVDGVVKIADLGLAREVAADPTAGAVEADNDELEIEGSPAYMSPEQIDGKRLDCRSDIYSLGAMLYNLVTGRVLFPGLSSENTILAHLDPATAAPDPRLYAPELSPDFSALLSGMLAKDRNLRRYQNWDDVIAAADALETGSPITPPNPHIETSCRFGV